MVHLVQTLLERRLIVSQDWERLPDEALRQIQKCSEQSTCLRALVEHGLLTEYQAGRLEAGTTFGLVLGSYRVLERLRTGETGVVFLAEHLTLRRRVAIKVLTLARPLNPDVLAALARLNAQGVVRLLDQGEERDPSEGTTLSYLVLELHEGTDLDSYVRSREGLAPAEVCDLLGQVLLALEELRGVGLYHGNLTPWNVLVSPEGRVGLLDVDLTQSEVAHPPGRTLEYLAPEQLRLEAPVDIRSDLYAVGGLLFWCVLGETPFPVQETVSEALALRLGELPSLCAIDPTLPPDLDRVLQRLLAVDPAARYQTPLEAAWDLLRIDQPSTLSPRPVEFASRVLVVVEDRWTQFQCRKVLEGMGLVSEEVSAWPEALESLRRGKHALLILSSVLLRASCGSLAEQVGVVQGDDHPGVLLLLDAETPHELIHLLNAGADDWLVRPVTALTLRLRIDEMLRLRAGARQTETLRQLLAQLPRDVREEASAATEVLVTALMRLQEQRQRFEAGRGERLRRWTHALVAELRRQGCYADQLTEGFVELLVQTVPLVDVGWLLLPDRLAASDEPFSAADQALMRQHPDLGAELVRAAGAKHVAAWGFLHMARDVIRHHHERYDGRGYPDRLRGEEIPLAARLVAPCLALEGLCAPRPYRSAFSPALALEVLGQTWGGQFDPGLKGPFLASMGRLVLAR